MVCYMRLFPIGRNVNFASRKAKILHIMSTIYRG